MSYSLADHLLRTLRDAGHPLQEGARILDFGCGEGGLVYEFRDKGWDAYGFDIHDRVAYRNEDDRRLFGFCSTGETDTSCYLLTEAFRIPFADDTFDLIVSTSVIEHVMDLPFVVRELARVSAPAGVNLHTYPNKWRIIEPHTYVPLGGAFQTPFWVYLCALCGVRNEFQTTCNAKQTAENNLRYMRTGLKYHTRAELHGILARDFAEVRDVTAEWNGSTRPPSFWRLAWQARRQRYPLRYISVRVPLRAVLTVGKKRQAGAARAGVRARVAAAR